MTDPLHGQAPLFGDPEPDAARSGDRARRPAAPAPAAPRGTEVDAAAAAASFDPTRWVMVGWRDAKGVTLTREQIAAALYTTDGPCARCQTTCHRYGPGGNPLCPTCRTAPTDERRSRP
jgi:hypothetical protein